MTARYKSACCCDESGNTGYGPCFMGWGSVPKTTYSPPIPGAKYALPMPVNVGPLGEEDIEGPDSSGLTWGDNTLTNPFDNWEFCDDSIEEELVMYCERPLTRSYGEAAVPRPIDEECPRPPDDDAGTGGGGACCNCGPYKIGNVTTGNVKVNNAHERRTEKKNPVFKLTGESDIEEDLDESDFAAGSFTPIITRYRSPWSTAKMPSLPYGYYSGGSGLPERVDDTLYHWSFETMSTRQKARSGNLYPMDGKASRIVGGRDGVNDILSGDKGYTYLGTYHKGVYGDGLPCYQQKITGPGFYDSLCVNVSFAFCADGFRSPNYALPTTLAQANIIGATLEEFGVPNWSTSRWGHAKASDYRYGDDETLRPTEQGGNYFWLQEISNHRPDERFIDFNLRFDDASSIGVLPPPAGGQPGQSRITETCLGVIHRERWWKKYHTSLLATDNRPGEQGVGDTEDARAYFDDGYFSPSPDWFGYDQDPIGTQPTILNNRSPEYVFKACAGVPIFSWEIALDSRLMCTDVDPDKHVRLGQQYTGPLGTLPILTGADAAVLVRAYTETQNLISCGLPGPQGGWPLSIDQVLNLPLGIYLFHLFNGWPVKGYCPGGVPVYFNVGYLTPGMANVLLDFGIIPEITPTGEENDYKVVKKKIFAFNGGEPEGDRGLCCFAGFESSLNCLEEHDTGGCDIPACGDPFNGTVTLQLPHCAFDKSDYYSVRIDPESNFWGAYNNGDGTGFWGTDQFDPTEEDHFPNPNSRVFVGRRVDWEDLRDFAENALSAGATAAVQLLLQNTVKVRDFDPDEGEGDYDGPLNDEQLSGYHYIKGLGWDVECASRASINNDQQDPIPECIISFIGCGDNLVEDTCRGLGGQWTKYGSGPDQVPEDKKCFLEDGTPDGIIDYCIPCAQKSDSWPSNPLFVPGPPANPNVKGACVFDKCTPFAIPAFNRCNCGDANNGPPRNTYKELGVHGYDEDDFLLFPEQELTDWRKNQRNAETNENGDLDACDCFEMSAGLRWTPDQGCNLSQGSQIGPDRDDTLPPDGFAYDPVIECDGNDIPGQGPCPSGYKWYPNRNCINTNGSTPRIPPDPGDFFGECSDRGPDYQPQNPDDSLPEGWEDLIDRKERWFYAKPGGWGFADEARSVTSDDGFVFVTGSEHKFLFPQILTRQTEFSNDIGNYTSPGPQYTQCYDSRCTLGCSSRPCAPQSECPSICGNSDLLQALEDVGCGLPIIAICGSVDPDQGYSPCDSVGLSHTCDGVWAQHGYYSLYGNCPDPGGVFNDEDAYTCSHINNASWIKTDAWLEFDESKGPEAPPEDRVNVFGSPQTIEYRCNQRQLTEEQQEEYEDSLPYQPPGSNNAPDWGYKLTFRVGGPGSENNNFDELLLIGGYTYVFDMSDVSFANYDFIRFSLLDNGVWNADNLPSEHEEYEFGENNITYEGVPGEDGAKVTLTVPLGLPDADSPNRIYYYCGPVSIPEGDEIPAPGSLKKGGVVDFKDLNLTGWIPKYRFNDDEITPQYRDRDWFSPPYAVMDVSPSAGTNPPCCWDSPVTRGFFVNPATGNVDQVLCPTGPRTSIWTNPQGEEIRFENARACLNPAIGTGLGNNKYCSPSECGFSLRRGGGDPDPICGPYPTGSEYEDLFFLCCQHTQQWFGLPNYLFAPLGDPSAEGTPEQGYTAGGKIPFPCNSCNKNTIGAGGPGSDIDGCPPGTLCTFVENPDWDPDDGDPRDKYRNECLAPDDDRRKNPFLLSVDLEWFLKYY